jgi:adenine-specific DNA-methyltransferase
VFTGDYPGFDIIIANPPYIKEYTNRKAFNGLKGSFYYQGKMDIWYFFACKGIDLLKNNTGILTFIAQNNWVTSYGASKLRNKITKEATILQLLDFSDYKIFKKAGIQTMIMIFKKDSEIDNYKFDYRRLIYKDASFQDILDLLYKNDNPKYEYLIPLINRKKYSNKTLTFSNSVVENILKKVFESSNFKLNEEEITNGIHPHHGKVDNNRNKILGNLFNVGDGIFVLSNYEKNSKFFTEKELELIKPFYTTRELKKYYANPNNSEWIIYTDSRYKSPENIKSYPNIKKHLDKFKKVITSDNKPYGLHRARDEKFFKGEKVIALRKCSAPTFTYTNFDCYVPAAFYVIKSKRINLKYLTALLNSKLIAFWLKHKGKMQGRNYQIDKGPLLGLPIYKLEGNKQEEVVKTINKILSVKSRDSNVDTIPLVRNIDYFIYQIYDLTDEEIKVVEEDLHVQE